ncbi:MAG: AraC family transcriptional regulator [Myxococcales bacterium]|nr:AraC family transcriptional regulator [Myxococcales bacterium]
MSANRSKGPHARLAAAIASVATRDGVFDVAVPGVACVRHSASRARQSRRWRACLAIVARGTKELALGRSTYALSPLHYTLTPLPLPLTSRIAAGPFLCLIINLEPRTLRQVDAEMDLRDEPLGGVSRGLFTGRLSAPMLDAAARLSGLFSSREASAVLGPGCVRELLFHALRGPNGPALRQFIRADGEAHRIARAVHHIESRLSARLDIEALASQAHVSRTAFFEQFKRVTSLSPVQYQKRLRLLEARRLLVEEATTAEDAGYRVGYQSPSQFSREYGRMFGEPPIKHATRLRRASAARTT